MGTLYKRRRRKAGTPVKAFVYYADYVDQNGKRCQVSLKTSYVDIARKKLHDLEVSVMRAKKKSKKTKPAPADHALVKQTRVCDQKGCAFRGKPAQQGVCYSSEGEIAPFDRLDEHEAELVAEIRALKKHEGKDYVRALEAHYITAAMTAAMNWQIVLDEVIRLRRDLAILRNRRG